MKTVLGLCLLSVLLSSGASLECETCHALSKNCIGSLQTCSAGQDTCVVRLTETSGVAGMTSDVVQKGCDFSPICKLEPGFLNFGQGRIQRNGLSCCVGDECRRVTPQLKPINTTTNGKQCPACFSVTGSCPSEVVRCTGADDYCFHMVTPEVLGVVVTSKGCTKKATCEKFKLTEGLVYAKVECQQANKGSLTSGSPLLALSGLLWMKIFY